MSVWELKSQVIGLLFATCVSCTFKFEVLDMTGKVYFLAPYDDWVACNRRL